MANEKTEILKLLIGNKEEQFSIRKISLLRKINYKSAYNSLKALEKDGIVDLKRIGNTIVSKFNDKFSDLVFRAEYLRREDLFKNKNFLVIYNRLAELKFPFILLVFGSYVKGTANKHSDIDLLLIINEENFGAVRTQISILPMNTHLTHMSYESFIRMATSKEFSVVSEALKKNVILIGIEEYYRLLKNVK
ncbi:MAG: nucleotidyltransferase domain-containing protein [Candidatus Nanoarchaeia archaeon]|nr:nucleotidyltransferase domain-containing protein [Candidatus Nanoarchaeia archaeon]MDD5740645.1 nucleotidyltransferase domain-containing protein [Candidatus Nanoarchaeia archaeon]